MSMMTDCLVSRCLLCVVSVTLWWSAGGAAFRSTETDLSPEDSNEAVLNLLERLRQQHLARQQRPKQPKIPEGDYSSLQSAIYELENRLGASSRHHQTLSQELSDVIRDNEPESEGEMVIPVEGFIRVEPLNEDNTSSEEDKAIYISAKSPIKVTLLSRLSEYTKAKSGAKRGGSEVQLSSHKGTPSKRVSCLDYPPC